jgi:hypothetical protein
MCSAKIIARSLMAMLVALCCLADDASAFAPQRKIESKTNDPRCERGKAFFRACYIPCIKSAKGAMGHVTNHCNVECKPELWVTNYLCRDPK